MWVASQHHSSTTHFIPVTDQVAAAAAVTAPWWLIAFTEWGQAILVAAGLALLVWRGLIAFRHWRIGRPDLISKDFDIDASL